MNDRQQRTQELEAFLTRHFEFLPENITTYEQAEDYFSIRIKEGIKYSILGFLNEHNFKGFVRIYNPIIYNELTLRDIYEVLHNKLKLSRKKIIIEKEYSEHTKQKIIIGTLKHELVGFFVIPKTEEALYFLLGENIIKAIF